MSKEGAYDRSPEAYAQHLAGYIRDPSTIRARTLDEFGVAPPLRKIAYWRSEVERVRSKPHNPYQADRWDGTQYDLSQGDLSRPAIKAASPPEADEPQELPTLRVLTPREWRNLSWRELAAAIARTQGFTLADVLGDGRKARLVATRQLIMVLLVERGNSKACVGRWLRRDHTTVINAEQVIAKKLERYPRLNLVYGMYRQPPALVAA